MGGIDAPDRQSPHGVFTSETGVPTRRACGAEELRTANLGMGRRGGVTVCPLCTNGNPLARGVAGVCGVCGATDA